MRLELGGIHRVRPSREVKLRGVEERPLGSQFVKANPIPRGGAQLGGKEMGWQADRLV